MCLKVYSKSAKVEHVAGLTLFSDVNGEGSTAMVANCSARLTGAISEIVSGIGIGLSRRRALGSTCVGKMGEQGRHLGN